MKSYKKRIFFLDRYPFIALILILAIGFFIFLLVKNSLPLNFFSGTIPEEEESKSYTIFIVSPTNDQNFSFVNRNETVPVQIKAKGAENLDYAVKVTINGLEVKTLDSPPYEFNWNPGESGEYEIVAYII
ncbi:MAG: Ig-like domain-containing protein, partial [Actinobacteria bacterium]|nr:Ig-like domain-containing protein [Actinomycetota bacterium]